MADILTTDLDPVNGLVDYTKFVKPYHSKVLEVLVEYIHTDCIDVTFTEDFRLSFGIPDSEVLELWGWTEEQAKKFFNCDSVSFQVINVDTGSNYWEVANDVSSYVSVGDVLLYQDDQLSFAEYTVTNVTVVSSTKTLSSLSTGSPICSTSQSTQSLDPNTSCLETETYTTTQIEVSETIPVGSRSDGVLHPYKSSFTDSSGNVVPTACWTQVPGSSGIYMRNVGIEFPSTIHVDENIECGGYGSIFQQAVGSPPGFDNGLDTLNNIVGVNTTLRYFEIQNRVGVPSIIGTWADAFEYGVKFVVSGSTGNDNNNYTVFYSVIVSGSPELLRVYTLENIPSNTTDGTIALRPWGYDEPAVCVDQGQSLAADANISENMSITINDINTNFVYGWDMAPFDMGGYDGGPFTYLVAFT